MNRDEFRAFMEKFTIAFPSYETWLREMKGKRADILENWCEQLASVSLEHAEHVLCELVAGRISMPPAYDRDKFIYQFRSHAKDRQYNLDKDESSTERRQAYRESLHKETMVEMSLLTKRHIYWRKMAVKAGVADRAGDQDAGRYASDQMNDGQEWYMSGDQLRGLINGQEPVAEGAPDGADSEGDYPYPVLEVREPSLDEGENEYGPF